MQAMYSPQYQIPPPSGNQPGPMLSSYPPQQPPSHPVQRHPFPAHGATSSTVPMSATSQPVFTPESNPPPGTCQPPPGQQGIHHPQTVGTPVNFGPTPSASQQQYQHQHQQQSMRHNNNGNSNSVVLPNGDSQQRTHVMPTPQQQQHPASESSRAALHGYIYDYLYKSGFHQSAQAVLREVPHVPVVPKPAADGSSVARGQQSKEDSTAQQQPQQKKGASTSMQNSPNDFFDDLLAGNDVSAAGGGPERQANGSEQLDGPGQPLHHQKSSNSSDQSSATSTSTNHSRFGFAAARAENDQGSATTPSDPGSSPSRGGTGRGGGR